MPMDTVFSDLHELDSHKTILVVDRGPKFAAICAEVKIPSTNSNLSQSRWSCAIQAVIEFHRVLSDLFPNSTKLLRVVISDTGGRFTTPPWSDVITDYRQVLHSFIGSKPDASADPTASSINNGLVMCMDALAEPTPLQKDAQKHLDSMKASSVFKTTEFPKVFLNASKTTKLFYERLQKFRDQQQKRAFGHRNFVRNSGTVIAFTTIQSFDEFKTVVDNMGDQVASRNELFKHSCADMNSTSDLVMLPISKLNLHIIHLAAMGEPLNEPLLQQCRAWAKVREGPVNVQLRWTTGANLIRTVHSILQTDYGVQSTTVQNIPMKEESNASKSTNYNVEMFHSNLPHSYLRQRHLLDPDSPIVNVEEQYSSTSLKWSTVNNKFVANEALLFENGAPATVAKVRDRPAICICNFILNGKYVLLDMDPESKVTELTPNFFNLKISHFFSLDNTTGAMFLNGVRFDHSSFPILPPPINERILLFPMVKFIEYLRLQVDYVKYPLSSMGKRTLFEHTTELAKHFGQYLPIHEADSVVYQAAEYFHPIVNLVNSLSLTPEIISHSKTFVYRCIGDNMSTLPIPQSTLLVGNMTAEDRARTIFLELARILKNYSSTSQDHAEFYNFFLGLTGLDLNEEFSKQQAQPHSPAVRQRSRSNSPVPTKKSKASPRDLATLHELFAAKAEVCWRGWKDFEGRIKSNSAQAKLYPGLITESDAIGGVRPSDRRRNNNMMEQ